MEVKAKTGWAVCEVTKKGDKGTLVRPVIRDVYPYDYYAVSGFVEVFYRKKEAVEAAKQLSENWGVPFDVVKVTVTPHVHVMYFPYD